jgi:hypothetical protein
MRKNFNITVGLKMIGSEEVMEDTGRKYMQENIWTSPKIMQPDIHFA